MSDPAEELRLIQEEMDTVQRILNCYVGHGGDIWRRILERLEREAKRLRSEVKP